MNTLYKKNNWSLKRKVGQNVLRYIWLQKWAIRNDVSKSSWLHFKVINVTVNSSLGFGYKVSQRISARALKCSKQILSRELSPTVCSISVSSHGWKACRGLDSQAFHGISLKRRYALEARGLEFRGNLSHVHQLRRLYVLEFADVNEEQCSRYNLYRTDLI